VHLHRGDGSFAIVGREHDRQLGDDLRGDVEVWIVRS
jgi:hypothetical protein